MKKNYLAQVADACELPFPENSFDALTCRHGIMFFPDMQRGLSEFHRVIKPGKRIAISAWGLPSKNAWATTIRDIIHEMIGLPKPDPNDPNIFRCKEPKTLFKLLEQTHFQDVSETEATGTFAFESPDHYWNLMTSVAAPIAAALKQVDHSTKEKIKKEVIKSAEKYDQNGRIVFSWSAWVCAGKK